MDDEEQIEQDKSEIDFYLNEMKEVKNRVVINLL